MVISCRRTASPWRSGPRRGAASRRRAAGPRRRPPGGCSGRRAAARRARRATARAAATANTTTRPWWNGPDIRSGKNCRPVRVCWLAAGSDGQHAARRQQVLHRVHAEHRREQRRHRRQGADVVGDAVRHALLLQAARQRLRQAARQPGDHQREEHADRQRRAGVLEGRAHARGHAAVPRRDAAHDRRRVGRGEHAAADPVRGDEQGEGPVREVDGQQHQADEAGAEHDHAGGGEAAGAEAVGEKSRHRARR